METVPAVAPRFDPVVHAWHRFRICGALGSRGSVDQADLGRELGLSKSALSKQVAVLVEAGYVRRARPRDDARRVCLELTARGAAAHCGHLAALLAAAGRPGRTRRRGTPESFPQGNGCHQGKDR